MGSAAYAGGSDDLPGRAYGQEVHAALAAFQAEFSPRVGSTFPALNEAEQLRLLASIQAQVEAAVQATRGQLAALTPPEEFQADHNVLLRFLDEIGEVARLITAAAEEGDVAALPALYRQSGVVLTTAQCALSDGFRPLARPFFGADAPDGC